MKQLKKKLCFKIGRQVAPIVLGLEKVFQLGSGAPGKEAWRGECGHGALSLGDVIIGRPLSQLTPSSLIYN